MSMTYYWRDGYRGHKGNPQEIGEELEKIQQENGYISAEVVVSSATSETSVLHPYFEWDDGEAANQYRLTQARLLVRSVSVQILSANDSDKKLTTRAFVEIKGEEGPYMSLNVVVKNNELRAQLIKQARQDIYVFENKYSVLEEVIEILQPVKSMLDKIS